MSTSEARDLAIVALLVVAPLALVFVVALLRGYHISIKFWRDKHDRR